MTRPNTLRLSSEYLSIAKVNSQEFTVSVPAGTTPYSADFDSTTPANPSALEQIMIRPSGDDYYLCDQLQFIVPGSPSYTYKVYARRKNASTVGFAVSVTSQSSQQTSFAARDFVVKVTSSRPPNII